MEDRLLAEFSVPSEPGNERLVRDRVRDSVAVVGLRSDRLERLLTAVAEAAMNAIEHGNAADPEVPVDVVLLASDRDVKVRISDRGSGAEEASAAPDLEAKLAGLQSPRGWGLFLIEHMVDGVTTSTESGRHTIELLLNLEGDSNATEHV